MSDLSRQFEKIGTNGKYAEKYADGILISVTAQAMKIKLDKKREEGRGGWYRSDICSNEELLKSLKAHIDKGDMIDVINLAAMIHIRNQIYPGKG